jgi:aldose 1-epimerase
MFTIRSRTVMIWSLVLVMTITISVATGALLRGEDGLSVTKESIGQTADGVDVDEYTLTNAHDLSIKIMTYGAIVTAVNTPDRDGKFDNIVLHLDSIADYEAGHPYFGAIVGRYGNRICEGKFTLDGEEYTLATNNDANHLHGGDVGFDKKVWTAEPIERDDCVGVKLVLVSPDGDEGYPGELTVTVEYTLNDYNDLKIEYWATTDAATPINVTNHSYWNLSGAGSGTILDDRLALNAPHYLPVDEGLIPTGEVAPVEGTPMSFMRPETIGSRIDQVEGGYDHCYVLNREGLEEGELGRCAFIHDPATGRVMTIRTTEPAVQFYTGNFLDGTNTTSEHVYEKNGAFCLETQHYPDSPNQPEFPNTILRPGETYRHTTVHHFGAENARRRGPIRGRRPE